MGVGVVGTGMSHGPAAPSPRSSSTMPAPHSAAGQSPVPYLFGALAAMLGLIALSLLALACSYWKLSGGGQEAYDDDDDPERQAGAGAGAEAPPGYGKAAPAGKAAGERWREHAVVIMAGHERPTFLATPASSRRGPNGARGVGVSVGSGPGDSEDGDEARCVECGARSWPARAADSEGEPGRIEQSGASGSSVTVISER